jgi:hypothetical protein
MFQRSGFQLFLFLAIALVLIFLHACEKESIFDVDPTEFENANIELKQEGVDSLTHSDSVAISKLRYYYNFLKVMQEQGYVFFDFSTFMSTDTSMLPEKLIVIRHDVHYRDVKWAYIAFQIEQIVIGAQHSTFYIMLNDPVELMQGSHSIQNSYLQLIHYLDSNDIDIQPHISPVDMYICRIHPSWENYSLARMNELFSRNYFWGKYKDGKRLNIRGEDVFNINSVNTELKSLLAEYNQEWTRQTGLPVQGYASHGSATCMNKVINNADLLDQWTLRNEGIFGYDTYNSHIFKVLTYLSDNTLPKWMKNPESIKPGRYQFLMHPYQWSVIK